MVAHRSEVRTMFATGFAVFVGLLLLMIKGSVLIWPAAVVPSSCPYLPASKR